jgi:hypothetical protein
MQKRAAVYLCHSHRSREWRQGGIWWRNGRWLAECTTWSKAWSQRQEVMEYKGPLAYRIAPPVLPLRQRPPPTRFGTSPCPSLSVHGRSTGRMSVLPLRARPPGLMSAVRCKAMPAFRCGLLTAPIPLFATLRLLRRRRKRGATTQPTAGDVALALLDARLRGKK